MTPEDEARQLQARCQQIAAIPLAQLADFIAHRDHGTWAQRAQLNLQVILEEIADQI